MLFYKAFFNCDLLIIIAMDDIIHILAYQKSIYVINLNL